MRDASPTGGALGQVSERELDQLNASIANLRQSQSLGQFKSNLASLNNSSSALLRLLTLRSWPTIRCKAMAQVDVITSSNVVTPAIQAAPAAGVAAQPQAAAPSC